MTGVPVAFVARPGVVPIRWLWYNGYYDGPLDGIAEGGGEHYVFKVTGESFNWRYRHYAYYPITEDEYAEYRRQHNLFREMVGAHTSYIYDADGTRSVEGKFATPEGWERFYNLALPELPSIEGRQAVRIETASPHCRRNRSRRYWERRRP